MNQESNAFDPERLQPLVSDLLRRDAAEFPEWTGGSDSDPRVTLVEPFGFPTETPLNRADE